MTQDTECFVRLLLIGSDNTDPFLKGKLHDIQDKMSSGRKDN